jgi:Do/DeqQ family serine protease
MKTAFRIILFAMVLAGGAVTQTASQTVVPVSQSQISLSFAPVVRKTVPSVVNIYAKRIVEAQQNPFARDPFFADLFKNFGQPGPRVSNSLGSGVILSADGLIVSNFHVVAEATDIRVVLSDRREFDAEVLLADEQSDIAVLKIDGAEGLTPFALRPSSGIEVGELVLAIGNPFGVGQTVSSGIISGLARSGGAVGNARAYFIQTDAPINPGNSGGALVDMNGDLIGINTSILTRSGGSNGIGFAIPADLVATFLKQAQAGNHQFTRPWAGMVGQLVDGALATQFGLERPEGMAVVELHPLSPFALAGLRQGDVVTTINGAPVNGPAEMLYHMTVLGVETEADVTFVRDGTRHHTKVAMILAPETPPRDTTTITKDSPLEGLTVSRINPAIIAAIGLPTMAEGIVVEKVDGVAAQIGFRPGDILVSVNGVAIATPADAEEAAKGQNRVWDITIERGGQQLSMRFQI